MTGGAIKCFDQKNMAYVHNYKALMSRTSDEKYMVCGHYVTFYSAQPSQRKDLQSKLSIIPCVIAGLTRNLLLWKMLHPV